jgi:nitroreductase
MLTGHQVRVLEALRAAPSTGNAQPWQVILREGKLFFAAQEDATYYRLSGRRGFHLVDAGIGMANILLARRDMTETSDVSGRVPSPASWTLLSDAPDLRAELGLPGNMRLIASIPLPA